MLSCTPGEEISLSYEQAKEVVLAELRLCSHCSRPSPQSFTRTERNAIIWACHRCGRALVNGCAIEEERKPACSGILYSGIVYSGIASWKL